MKTLYFECNMGAAGDMLAAALLELHPHPENIISQLNRAGIPHVAIDSEPAIKCSIKGTHFSVSVNGEHECSCDVGYESPFSEDEQSAGSTSPQAHAHEGHEHAHEGHEHTHEGHEHAHEGHEHTHEGHEHAHKGHEHAHEGHEHAHESHEHAHEGHEHPHEGHEHPHEGHEHAHEGHEHAHEGHEHTHEGHEHAHEGHEHTHEGHEHTHAGHEHHHLSDIAALINGLTLPAPVREHMLAVYTLIAEAESQAHDSSITQIHFHEVGAMDAVADIAAVCLLIHELAPDIIAASPVRVGSGQVRCAHGILPVPAPATAHLLQGIPSYGGQVRGELCTPTGAALLRHFAQFFGPQPLMRVEKIGYGMGQKDFPQANCLRAMLGEDSVSPNGEANGTVCAEPSAFPDSNACPRDSVVELSCNLDDMTPEEIGFAVERLWEAGALDVYTVSIGMKKNRPGVMLCCLCREEQREKLTRLLFQHTTTLGVRETVHKRSVLQRTTETWESAYGQVRLKKACGWGVQREKAEYGDLAELARKHNLPLRKVRQLLHNLREQN